jgi:septal ring factor EnvC (AmiA/AmiB activator)
VRGYETGLATMRTGLREIAQAERAIEARFNRQSDTLSRLLGALQSIQSSAEISTLLHPGGPAATARAAMMLSDVTPSLEAEVAALRAELEALTELRALQMAAAEDLQRGLDGAQAARTALSQAISERRTISGMSETDAAALSALVNSADSLAGLAGMLTSASNITAPALPEGLRIGDLPLPVNGRLVGLFNEADAAGITRPGWRVATAPQALVTAPFPATVRYMGPLLDYGHVAILEPEAGSLLVLAGLAGTYGQTGDVVDAGAPVGIMGGRTQNKQQILIESTGASGQDRSETLYIEVRQGQTPLDPGRWFADATK